MPTPATETHIGQSRHSACHEGEELGTSGPSFRRVRHARCAGAALFRAQPRSSPLVAFAEKANRKRKDRKFLRGLSPTRNLPDLSSSCEKSFGLTKHQTDGGS